MQAFTLIIDYSNYYGDYSELSKYLLSINGIEDVNITSEYLLSIYIKYDEKIINAERIKLEILAFDNLLNYPCIYGFNKHFKEAKIHKLIWNSICCDFCYFNMIEDLWNIDGIMGVESNFYDKFWNNKCNDEKYIINIFYNSKILSNKRIKEIENELNIYR